MGKGDDFNVVAVNDPFLDVDYMVGFYFTNIMSFCCNTMCLNQ